METRWSRSSGNTKSSNKLIPNMMQIRMNRRANTNTVRSSSKSKAKAMDVPAPDLTDFMNDMFFGAVNTDIKAYNLSGNNNGHGVMNKEEEREEESFERSSSSRSSRFTEEWLDEARRLVASSSSPNSGSRCNSPSRVVASPRFASNIGSSPSPSPSLFDGRDPLSRSARRHRAVDSFSEEILSKVVNHTRNKSETFAISSDDQLFPSSSVQKWISNIIKPPIIPNPTTSSFTPEPPITIPTPRKSRFHSDPSSPRLPIPSSRAFNNSSDTLLSPPKNPIELAQRRTLSSPENINSNSKFNVNGCTKGAEGGHELLGLNGFLKEQRRKIRKILNGELQAKVKIILSGPSNSTSSMVAAVCYAWLQENKTRSNKDESNQHCLVIPVMNMRRGKMWNQRQVAWLFYHLGLDATSILFSDEVDIASLMMAGQVSVLTIGQNVLRMSDGVGSQCTILTDNYCEDAYHLLQTPLLKNLLLAGILMDTKNLDASAQLSMTRDAEAVQLLMVGSIPNYRNELYDQLMQYQKDGQFLDALQQCYGKPPHDGSNNGEVQAGVIAEKNQTVVSPHDHSLNQQKKSSGLAKAKTDIVSPKYAKPGSLPIQTPAREAPNASRGKNKSFLAKWFGFGSK